MARTVLAAILIVSVFVLSGCFSIDSGASQLKYAQPQTEILKASEADLAEGVSINRNEYRQYLESLMVHYKQSGNNMKLSWSANELNQLDKIPQYTYILDATVAAGGLRATDSIELADYIYSDILRRENKARLTPFAGENLLRRMLREYSELIRRHPTSDKIDDAAYRAGIICEDFHDYTIAVLYFQRAYQWDPATALPAKFKAAYVLDNHLSRRGEALELYQDVLDEKSLGQNYLDYAKMRIDNMTKSSEKLEE